MNDEVRFIHAADVHLGAAFRGLRATTEIWGERMLRAIPESLERLVQYALTNAVDFVIFSGDVFDTARPSYADFRLLYDELQKLTQAGIPVYMCTGNHDPYTSWMADLGTLPRGVHMFPADEPGFFVYGGPQGSLGIGEPRVLLGGRGYYNQTVAKETHIEAGITRADAERTLGTSAPFAVGVLHTGLHFDTQKAPVSLRSLYAADMDYWALGHIHDRYIDDIRHPRVAFSGCIQGRDIKEDGARGCFEVTLRPHQSPELKFVPLASVAWQILTVDVSSCTTLSDIVSVVVRELYRVNGQALCDEMIERITLTGTTSLHATLAQPQTLEDIRAQINDQAPIFYCDALIQKTHAPRDSAALRREGMFSSVVMSQTERLAENPAAIRAMLEEAFLSHNTMMPALDDESIKTLTTEANELILDILEGVDYE